MNANTTKTILGGLLPFASNPLVLAAVGAGAAAWLVSSLFDDDEDEKNNGSSKEKNCSEPHKQPFKQTARTVRLTAQEPSTATDTTGEKCVQEPFDVAFPARSTSDDSEPNNPISDTSDLLPNEAAVDDEAAKKEMIRKAMSELGKRSAATRRHKKKA